jgi:hypothetical protein
MTGMVHGPVITAFAAPARTQPGSCDARVPWARATGRSVQGGSGFPSRPVRALSIFANRCRGRPDRPSHARGRTRPGTRARAATPSMPPTPRETVALRLGLLDLVRLVLDDSWTLERSAEQLRAHVRSERALRTLRARVWRVGQERSTPTGERMLATIEAALVLDGQQDRPAVGPSSGVRVRS